MRRKSVVLLLTSLFLFGSLGAAIATEYDHETKVRGMVFAWKVDGDKLHVKLTGRTTGWIGIGFNPEKQMKGADYVVGFVRGGKVTLRDDYGDSARNHESDEKLGGTSDVTLVKGEEKGQSTTLEFTLPLNSGDKYDSVIEPEGETIVLLAYGGRRDSFRQKHKFRTMLKVNLASGKVE